MKKSNSLRKLDLLKKSERAKATSVFIFINEISAVVSVIIVSRRLVFYVPKHTFCLASVLAENSWALNHLIAKMLDSGVFLFLCLSLIPFHFVTQ